MTQFAYLAAAIVFGGLFGAIAWKMLKGEIGLAGILCTKSRSRDADSELNQFSPARVQLAITTLITANYYLTQVIHDPTKFPMIPTAWLLGLGASHGIYLGGKAESMFSVFRDVTRRRPKK